MKLNNISKITKNDGFSFSQLKPSMMTPLLRKLVHDVAALTDQTIVPLRVCEIFLKFCVKLDVSWVF